MRTRGFPARFPMFPVPDHLFSGPDMPSDETVRQRLFGEC
jgi:hypothetical protein